MLPFAIYAIPEVSFIGATEEEADSSRGAHHARARASGETVDTREKLEALGAEIIRLWVAASDYSGDIAGDDKILARVVDGYRRIRNTLRFLLANTADFDPAKDMLPVADWLEIDRYALALMRQPSAKSLAA